MRGRPATPPAVRFARYVEKTDGCWLWTGGKDKDGYGKFRVGSHTDGTRRTIRAHVFAWQRAHDRAVPDGMWVLHTCDTPACVRPDHLYLGTAVENGRDARERMRHSKRRLTHCKRGHEFTPENTIVRKGDGTRHCRECHNARRRKSPKE